MVQEEQEVDIQILKSRGKKRRKKRCSPRKQWDIQDWFRCSFWRYSRVKFSVWAKTLQRWINLGILSFRMQGSQPQFCSNNPRWSFPIKKKSSEGTLHQIYKGLGEVLKYQWFFLSTPFMEQLNKFITNELEVCRWNLIKIDKSKAHGRGG